MASLFELVNRLAVRAVGRNPKWSTQEDTTGAPSSSTAGTNIRDAVKTLISVPLREEAHTRTSRIDPTYDDDTVYRVTIDDHDVDTNTDSGAIPDRDALLEQMRDDINADADASEIVTAAVQDGELVTTGDGDEDYDFDVSIVSGDGTIEATIDPTGGTAYVWLYGPEDWEVFPDGEFELTRRGRGKERITTSGLERIYVEVVPDEPDGADVSARDLVAHVGPGVME